MARHNTLTGSQCHEPKGADSATADQIYVADGAGSGSFQDPDFPAKVATSTDHGVVRFDGTTGTQQDSGVTIDDSDNLAVPGTISEGGDLLSALYAAAPVTKYKDADKTLNANATLEDDDDLAGFSLAGSTVYILEGELYWDNSVGTAGIQFAFQVVSGTLTDSDVFWINLDPDGNVIQSSGPTSATTAFTVSGTSGTATSKTTVTGTVEVNSAAVLDLQWAQDASTANDTVLRKGSFIRFTKA